LGSASRFLARSTREALKCAKCVCQLTVDDETYMLCVCLLADQLITDLKKQRDEFQANVKKQAKATEAAWEGNKAQLDSQWKAFEAQVKTYIDTVAKQLPQQQALFRDVAAAQVKAWREAANAIQDVATKFAAGRRADVDAAVTKMKADASEAEARLQKLNQAGNESWAALSAALAESRKTFDRANQAAWDAVKRAAPPSAA
jgi:hypothetical protein